MVDNFKNTLDNEIQELTNEINNVHNIMLAPYYLFNLEKRNNLVINKILNTTIIPDKITRLKLKIIPNEENKIYYSFDGIETILQNLFNNIEDELIKLNIETSVSYFKVFYILEDLFNIPVLNLEIYFFNKLSTETICFLTNKLRIEGFYFTGNIGKIEEIEHINYEVLKDILHIPLIVGYPDFKNNGLLRKYEFSNEQIAEMNHINKLSIVQLPMNEIVNNSPLSVFKYQKFLLNNSRVKYDEFLSREEEEVNNLIRTIFYGEENIEDLPF